MVLVIKLNNYFSGRVLRNQNQGKFILISKSQFLTSLELYSQLKKLSHMPGRNYMELGHVSHLDDGPSSCWFE